MKDKDYKNNVFLKEALLKVTLFLEKNGHFSLILYRCLLLKNTIKVESS